MDLTFTDLQIFLVDCGVDPLLDANCHHQIFFSKLIFNLNIHFSMIRPYWVTQKEILTQLKNPLRQLSV